MIDGINIFDQPVKNGKRTYANNDNIGKTITGQEHDYTTGCLLDYVCFKSYYDMAAIDLRKQQTLDPDPKAIQIEQKTQQYFSLLKRRKK